MMKFEKFKGLIAAPFTPLNESGKLNTDMIPVYYDFLQKNGVSGVFINGTTGEGVSLTQKEKQLSAEIWARKMKSGGTMRIINMVGGNCYEECIENAIHSAEIGFPAIAVMAPCYFKPDTGRLSEFIARIGESVPDVPVYFYHIPVFTGVRMPVIDLIKELSGMLPNFAGVKYSHGDLMDFMSCLRCENGKYDLLWGKEEWLLAALSAGAEGSVGSTFNFAAPLYNELIKAFSEGMLDKARDFQQVSINIIGLINKYGGIAAGKTFMRYVGIDCGKFRLPVKNMSDDLYPEFVKDVKHLNIDHLLSGK